MKKLLEIFLFITVLYTIPIFTQDWKDLEEGEKKEVYGSEKSKKYLWRN